MRKLLTILSVFLALTMAMLACGSEEEEKFVTYGSIEGAWVIQSSEFLGAKIPGDGSMLTFHGCTNEPCSGVDYMASDETTGEFDFTISEDSKTITIIDDSDDGGAYTGEWEVVSFKGNRLKLSIDSGLFGIMTITLEK